MNVEMKIAMAANTPATLPAESQNEGLSTGAEDGSDRAVGMGLETAIVVFPEIKVVSTTTTVPWSLVTTAAEFVGDVGVESVSECVGEGIAVCEMTPELCPI